MKKNDYLLLVAVLIYSFLFFKQSAGINFLLFNIVWIAFQLIRQPFLVLSRSWLTVCIGCLLTSAAILWHPTNLAITANIISLAVLSGLSLHPYSSFLIAAANSVYSFFASLLLRIGRSLTTQTESKQVMGITPSHTNMGAVKIGLPILITSLFFFIYRAANPAFEALTNQLFSGWISEEWFKFTFFGFLILVGSFYPVAIEPLTRLDANSPDFLKRARKHFTHSAAKISGLRTEYQIGLLSLALLNSLLLFVNGTDLFYLLITQSLPEGVNHADYVHQGVYALIISIVLAILLILYFFRGNLNFFTKNKSIKLLAYVWIIQNAVLVYTTVSKTILYVEEFSLTHKRIGVFVYLLLTTIGLIITSIKIARIRSNWFLFRKTTWTYYIILVIASFINWDVLITRYNIHYFNNSQQLDIHYLINLTDANLPELAALLKNSPTPLNSRQEEAIQKEINTFLNNYADQKWQSWNYQDFVIANQINN